MKKRSKHALLYAGAAVLIVCAALATIKLFLLFHPIIEPIILLSPTSGTTTTRSFYPAYAVMDLPITVNLNVAYQAGTRFYDIIEFIPNGFSLSYAGTSRNRPDLGQNAIQIRNFNPASGVNSYVITPNAAQLCPDGAATYSYGGLYVAPPERTRTLLGPAALQIKPGEVVRTLQDQTDIASEINVVLDIYPACEDGYTIEENIPSGWTITDAGSGNAQGEKILWTQNCGTKCPRQSLSYKVIATNQGQASFTGTYQFTEGSKLNPQQVIQGADKTEVVDVDCKQDCSSTACAGQYCSNDNTQVCSNGACVEACVGTDFYCLESTSCNAGDVQYGPGATYCESVSGGSPFGQICCHIQQTCESQGGVCLNTPQQCPAGYNHLPSGDPSCNGGIIPQGQGQEHYCCK